MLPARARRSWSNGVRTSSVTRASPYVAVPPRVLMGRVGTATRDEIYGNSSHSEVRRQPQKATSENAIATVVEPVSPRPGCGRIPHGLYVVVEAGLSGGVRRSRALTIAGRSRAAPSPSRAPRRSGEVPWPARPTASCSFSSCWARSAASRSVSTSELDEWPNARFIDASTAATPAAS